MSYEIFEPNPLVSKGYSLEADMLSGWRPPKYKEPYPMSYMNDFEYNPKKNCVYSGYRPSDSFIIHSDYTDSNDCTYSFDFSDPAIISYHNKSKKADSTSYGMSEKLPEDCLIFDSKFECGNLDRVEFVSKDEYDLFMRVDSNTSGHMH